MDQPDRRLAAIATRQYGVFSAQQAEDCGLTRRVLDRRVDRCQLVRAQPGVYVPAGAPESWRRDTVAAVLSMGHLAAASHRTAAELWGLTTSRGSRIDVVTRRWDRVRRRRVAVHESKDLIEEDVKELDGIPVTCAARTVVDLGATEPEWLVATCVDTGLRLELFTIAEVDAFVARVARKGRRGVGVIRPILELRSDWDGPTESPLEDRFRRLIAKAGLPMPVSQYALKDHDGLFVCRSDFAYPERRVLIELDSEAFHMDRSRFIADRRKQNAALGLGWRTLRFTWRDLSERPAAVLRLLADI